MGNLFLKEKEKWRLWFGLGLLGAVTSFLIIQLNTPHESSFFTFLVSVVPAVSLGVVICWWMQFTKRFEYWRAFRVLALVLLLASFPVLMLAKLTLEMNQVVWLLPVVGHILAVVFVTLLGAWVAKRPKQYY